jgi:hemoglobin
MTGIYEAIGGKDAVAAAVDLFYAKVLADPSLAPWFTDVDMDRLRAHQRAFLTAALGGPSDYDGRDMAVAHAGLDVTGEAFDQVATHLAATLTELGVDGETVATIVGAVAPLRDDIVSVPASSA